MQYPSRRYDIDGLRVIGILSVFVFHVMMYFNTWRWHAKNGVTTPAFQPFNLALLAWIMPFMFLLAGFATSQSLLRRTAGEYARERLLRLGVPILLAAFLLSPFQVYSERVTYGEFTGSFRAFLPHYFDGWYTTGGSGNFAWQGLHLWFVVVLLVSSLATLPFFLCWGDRKGPLRRLLEAGGPAAVLLLLPFLLLAWEGILFGLGLDASQSGWPFGLYLAEYIVGYTLLPTDLFRMTVRKLGKVALIAALLSTLPTALLPEPSGFSPVFVAYHAMKIYNGWFSMVGLLYLGERYLNRQSPALQYCSEAVMPFYILHQPVIVTLGFFVRSVSLPVAVKFPLFLLVSFGIIMALYHVVVRPVNGLRFLFGMKPLRQPAALPPSGRREAL